MEFETTSAESNRSCTPISVFLSQWFILMPYQIMWSVLDTDNISPSPTKLIVGFLASEQLSCCATEKRWQIDFPLATPVMNLAGGNSGSDRNLLGMPKRANKSKLREDPANKLLDISPARYISLGKLRNVKIIAAARPLSYLMDQT